MTGSGSFWENWLLFLRLLVNYSSGSGPSRTRDSWIDAKCWRKRMVESTPRPSATSLLKVLTYLSLSKPTTCSRDLRLR